MYCYCGILSSLMNICLVIQLSMISFRSYGHIYTDTICLWLNLQIVQNGGRSLKKKDLELNYGQIYCMDVLQNCYFFLTDVAYIYMKDFYIK